jgi:hypothetical protein
MKDYIKEAIAHFGEDITRSATTPAKRNLFEIKENSVPLTDANREIFHSVVAKLLYVSKRGRLDIQLPIAFLCTQVSCSTKQDWSKLKRVDASYAVHEDMKSHTGGVVSFRRGAAMSKSSKQKLNTKSSTEAESVGASNTYRTPFGRRSFWRPKDIR